MSRIESFAVHFNRNRNKTKNEFAFQFLRVAIFHLSVLEYWISDGTITYTVTLLCIPSKSLMPY